MTTRVPSLKEIRAMTPQQRFYLYQNAKKLSDNGGHAVMDALDAAGVPLYAGSMLIRDPVQQRIEEIVWSVERPRGGACGRQEGATGTGWC